jgi:hypothetical protein
MYGSLLDDDEIPTITIRGGGAKFKWPILTL